MPESLRRCQKHLDECNYKENRHCQSTKFGWKDYCLPFKCDFDNDCPPIGEVCWSGKMSAGFCVRDVESNSNFCEYDGLIMIANCIFGMEG